MLSRKRIHVLLFGFFFGFIFNFLFDEKSFQNKSTNNQLCLIVLSEREYLTNSFLINLKSSPFQKIQIFSQKKINHLKSNFCHQSNWFFILTEQIYFNNIKVELN